MSEEGYMHILASKYADGIAEGENPHSPKREEDDGLRWVPLCALCRSGAGGECHTPGCALWINRAPDIPVLTGVCGRLLVGQGGDTWDPLCMLESGHAGSCQPEET